MDIEDFKSDLLKIEASEQLKKKIYAKIILLSEANATKGNEESRKKPFWVTKKSIVLATTAFILILSATLISFPGLFFISGLGFTDNFSQRIDSIYEINNKAYASNEEGILYSFTEKDGLKYLDKFPATKIFSDGMFCYYSESKSIMRFSVDSLTPTSVYSDKFNLTLDFVDAYKFIYHNDNDQYFLVDRSSNEPKAIFTDSDQKLYSICCIQNDTAIVRFVNNNNDYQIYSVNLKSGQKNWLYDGQITDVELIDNQVYFLLRDQNILWTIKSDGSDLKKIDLSSLEFTRLQRLTASGSDLYLVTDEDTNTYDQNPHGSIYQINPLTGKIIDLNVQVGYVDRFGASENYICYYDLGTNDTEESQYIGSIESMLSK